MHGFDDFPFCPVTEPADDFFQYLPVFRRQRRILQLFGRAEDIADPVTDFLFFVMNTAYSAPSARNEAAMQAPMP